MKMNGEKIIIAISLLVSLLSFSTTLAINQPPCPFAGAIKVNGISANGSYVTAYSNIDGKYLATAEQTTGFGTYEIIVDATGSNIRFKYRNVFVNEPAQYCNNTQLNPLDLTVSCIDCDNDGYNYTVDCDESNPNINPGKPELCNGIDDNCDGIIDNFTESCYTGPAGTLNNGICKAGIKTCTNGAWSNCYGEVLPQTETCNGIDDNCDGSVDEGVCGGGHSTTTTVFNGGNNGGNGNSGSGTNNVNTTTIITTTTLVPQTTISINNTSNTEKIASVTTTIPGTLGMTGLFSSGINSLGYWFILLIIIIILSIIVLIKKINSNKNHPNETSENENSTTTNDTNPIQENETTTTNETKNETQ